MKKKTSHSPLFSVVIPLYNKAPHVKRSLGSVLEQTYKDFELIVVNDASTDDSVVKVREYEDSRIRLLHRNKPGPGGYAARNLGIEKARGKWIAFLDADDEWKPQHLEKMAQLANRYPECDCLSCGWEVITPAGLSGTNRFYKLHRDAGMQVVSLKRYLEAYNAGAPVLHTNVVCLANDSRCRELFPAGEVEKGGDLYAWLLYLAKSKKLAWSPHIGAVYYRNATNMVTKQNTGSPDFQRTLYERIEGYLTDQEKTLLQKYVNRKLWKTWLNNIFNTGEKTFSLPSYLMWRRDWIHCSVCAMLSTIPAHIYILARKGKNGMLKVFDRLFG